LNVEHIFNNPRKLFSSNVLCAYVQDTIEKVYTKSGTRTKIYLLKSASIAIFKQIVRKIRLSLYNTWSLVSLLIINYKKLGTEKAV